MYVYYSTLNLVTIRYSKIFESKDRVNYSEKYPEISCMVKSHAELHVMYCVTHNPRQSTKMSENEHSVL